MVNSGGERRWWRGSDLKGWSNKIQVTVKKQLINRFKENIIEGQTYQMAYFSIIPNQGNCRTAEHEFKLIFLNRTTVVPIPDDAILKTCFSLCPFDEFLKMTENYVYLVDVISLLTSVGEEKEYVKDGKVMKMIILELSSKELIIRCALFGEYVDEVHHFLGFGYMEQPVVVIQLVKVKFFKGSEHYDDSMVDQGINKTQPLFIVNESNGVSLEDDFIRLTRRCTIEELHDNNEKRSFVVFGIMRSIMDEESWWYSACVCGKSIQSQDGAYYYNFCQYYVTNVTPTYKIKIAIEDDNGYGVFVLFDREAVYLLKKSCADLFGETNYKPFIDFLGEKDVEVPGLDDISSEVDIIKEKEKNIDESIPVDRECSIEIEKILFAVLDGSPIHVIKKETVENPSRGAKVKRNLKKVFGDVADEEFGPTSNVLKNRDS
ncbi:uncharacterized protein LOC107459665 [Arachis duranensis]|uniref:Uncharacterized protein LOC107459665 n=1 Tax=Arachis duranensis TaxID=130453 RepID=A0A9C6WA77_ARADU|nr:uncharacterized protein LOC107459665 [Arachis duranensis]